MKNNKNGFMLAEVIVVSVIIVTTLMTLYTGVNRIYKLNNERTKYNDVNALYAASTMTDFLIQESAINVLIYDMKTNNYNNINLTCTNTYFDIAWKITYCNKIMSMYNVKSIYFTVHDFEAVNILGANPEFTDYIKYLKNTRESIPSEYAMIVVTNDDKYATFAIK